MIEYLVIIALNSLVVQVVQQLQADQEVQPLLDHQHYLCQQLQVDLCHQLDLLDHQDPLDQDVLFHLQVQLDLLGLEDQVYRHFQLLPV